MHLFFSIGVQRTLDSNHATSAAGRVIFCLSQKLIIEDPLLKAKQCVSIIPDSDGRWCFLKIWPQSSISSYGLTSKSQSWWTGIRFSCVPLGPGLALKKSPPPSVGTQGVWIECCGNCSSWGAPDPSLPVMYIHYQCISPCIDSKVRIPLVPMT